MVGDWVNMSATIVADDEKLKKKKHWLKRPKAVPKKRNLDQNENDSKSYIWSSFSKIIILGIQLHIKKYH